MELLILNENLEAVTILDNYESLIWTDRFSSYGDFEIGIKVTRELLKILKSDYYLTLSNSEHSMIIEEKTITSNIESGNELFVAGRSLEALLTYRIIWYQTTLSGNFQNGIKKLLDENAITPTDNKRKISNLIFEPSTDPTITGLTIDAQFTGDELYSAIKGLCDEKEIGFKITLSDDNKFVFKLYSGKDRSYNQVVNPYVIFSQEFDNIISSEHIESKKPLKTVALVAGEGEGKDRKTTTVGDASGLARRELFVDAREISSNVEGGTLTPAVYLEQLAEKGKSQLAEYAVSKVFDGEGDFSKMFKYGEDFFMGDIVQLENEYGVEAQARITEIIFSMDKEGVSVYPTFVVKN